MTLQVGVVKHVAEKSDSLLAFRPGGPSPLSRNHIPYDSLEAVVLGQDIERANAALANIDTENPGLVASGVSASETNGTNNVLAFVSGASPHPPKCDPTQRRGVGQIQQRRWCVWIRYFRSEAYASQRNWQESNRTADPTV